MNIERLAALVASGESETLEFKAATGTRREAAMTVCCLSGPMRRSGAVRHSGGLVRKVA